MKHSKRWLTYGVAIIFLVLKTTINAMTEQREQRLCSLALYQLKNGHGQDAIKLLKRPLENNYTPAKNVLGMCYQYGVDVEKNLAHAAELYEEAAKAGHIMALFNLGYCYEKGLGVEKDLKTARKLYQATFGFFPQAYYRLGRLYIEELDTEKNQKLGFNLFEQAAEAGHEKAFFAIGRCYETGTGVTQNYNEASTWYRSYLEKTDPKTECSICNERMVNKQKNSLLLACPRRHIFHERCLLKWIHTCLFQQTKPTCPICREQLAPQTISDQ